MFLKKMDYISPQITLFYHKRDRHVHAISGILTIISYVLLISCSGYFISLLLNRKDPTSYFFNKFVDDVGTFPLNSSSMFHYITVGKVKIDFKAINIVGVPRYISYYQNNNNLSLLEHWVYGPCEKEDLGEYDSLVEDMDVFIGGACVQKVWSLNDQKYYSKGEKGFYYPSIRHGASHPLANCFGVIIEKCRNESSFNNNECYDNTKISKYVLDSISLAFYIIDHYIDVGNYNNPAASFFYKITNGILETSFSSNQINFNPALVKTHNGLLFDNVVEEYSYLFDQNAKSTLSTGNSGILCAFYVWMQNRVQMYDRVYKRIQDTCASIGGMTKLILISAKILNYFIVQYTLFIDTEKAYSKVIMGKKLPQNPTIKISSGNLESSYAHLSDKYSGNYPNQPDKNIDSMMITTRPNMKNSENGTFHFNITKNINKSNNISLNNGKNSKEINGKKINYTEKKTFIEFIYFRLFGSLTKNKKEKKAIEMLFSLRMKVLSEEFMFEHYAWLKMQQNMNIQLTSKHSSNKLKLDIPKSNYQKTTSINPL